MPAPGGLTAPEIHKRSLPPDMEVRRAQRVVDPPHWLVGKRTAIGLALTAAGFIGQFFDFDVPEDEINSLLDSVLANWDGIMELVTGVGVLVTAIGSKFKQKRLQQATMVVSDTARSLVDVKHELATVKAAVEAAPLTESTKAKILELPQ